MQYINIYNCNIQLYMSATTVQYTYTTCVQQLCNIHIQTHIQLYMRAIYKHNITVQYTYTNAYTTVQYINTYNCAIYKHM
jgi:hypothetical protein